MIKRYILHIEAHRRHLPRISFKRAPRAGDRVVDGGVMGTLVPCNFCSTTGFLHEPDPVQPWRAPRKKSTPKPPLLGLIVEDLVRNMAQPRPYPTRPVRSYHTPRPAMDFNAPSHVELKVDEDKVETEMPVVDLTIIEPSEHVEIKIDEESPEELELDYKLGKTKYKRGDVVWTHKSEYVVDKLENKTLYLVRRDVWDERKKNATHVKIEVDAPAEHVELKNEEEKPTGSIVQLKFD